MALLFLLAYTSLNAIIGDSYIKPCESLCFALVNFYSSRFLGAQEVDPRGMCLDRLPAIPLDLTAVSAC